MLDTGTFLPQGDDAINFFAQYGANSPIKFVHLVRANKGHDFPPYDLVVVNPRECAGDYYLMSSAGLVHVCHGEPSEFTPLSEWMRQSTMFNMLQSIRFFKCYLHSKCFKLWRDNVRYKLFCQQRRKLSHRLFLAKDSFAGPYVELRRHMIDTQVHPVTDSRPLYVNHMPWECYYCICGVRPPHLPLDSSWGEEEVKHNESRYFFTPPFAFYC